MDVTSFKDLVEIKPPDKSKTRGFCTIDGHLNSPITPDEVDFLLKYDEFYCWRHKHIKALLKSSFHNAKSFRDLPNCPWDFIEKQILACQLNQTEAHKVVNLQALVEAAILNYRIHHQAYFGRQMNVSPRLDQMREIFSIDKIQKYYKNKIKVEKIKSALTDKEHILGEFHSLAPNISIEKEITINQDPNSNASYLFPTTIIICVLDNIQSNFHMAVNVALKEQLEGIPGLFQHYLDICNQAHTLREKYWDENKFFDLMKDWDARIMMRA